MDRREREKAAETIPVSKTGEEKETGLLEGTSKDTGRRDQICRPGKQYSFQQSKKGVTGRREVMFALKCLPAPKKYSAEDIEPTHPAVHN